MGILSKLKSVFVRNSTDITEGMSLNQLAQLIQQANSSVGEAGVAVTPDSAMRCAAVYACVRVLAESEALLPLPVYRIGKDDRREKDRTHPLFKILNQTPNKWQTAFEFREMMMGHLCLRGNAYAFIGRDMLTKDVRQLIPLHPTKVSAKQLSDTTVEYEVYDSRGSQKTFAQSEILHIRGLSSDGLTGLSPIEAYRNAVSLALASERHQSKSFANGVKFPGYLKTDKTLSDGAIKNLRESFQAAHSGENANSMPLLEEGMDWVSVGMTADDAQTIETRKMQRGEIASIFRVPLHLINGDTEASKGWSTLEQQSSEFVTYSLLPWFERWEQAITRDLLTEKERDTYFVEHLVDGLLRGDTQARYTAYGAAIRDGWMSRNEVRQRENLNPETGLDAFLQPVQTQPTGQPNVKTPPNQ